MNIPWAIPNIQEEDKNFVKETIDSGWYVMGKIVKEFEDEMLHISGTRYAIAVNNGTSALEILMIALGIGPGDEVIIPAYSYIATANAVKLIGAIPVFVDVDEYMTINANLLENAVTKNTRAVITVDLTGSPCDYDSLTEKCKKLGIFLIVDGAQSLGSYYNNKSCLSYGIASTTSFHTAKILTSIEGGMIFTDDLCLAEKIRKIRCQGESSEKYFHDVIGGNYRMTDILASFAINQARRFKQTLEDRNKKVEYYKNKLTSLNQSIGFLSERDNSISSNFIFPIFTYRREKLCNFQKKNGIDTRNIYPKIIPHQIAYNLDLNFPVAEKFCRETISLPLYHNLTYEEIDFIADKIRVFFNEI